MSLRSYRQELVGLRNSWDQGLACHWVSLTLSLVSDSHGAPASFSFYADWLSLLFQTSWLDMVESQLLR